MRIQLSSTQFFACHEACWTIFARHAKHAGVEIDKQFLRRLWEVCYSIPYYLGPDALAMDHDYGGLGKRVDSSHRYPWEDPFDLEPLRRAPVESFLNDPISTREINDLIQGATRRLNPPAAETWKSSTGFLSSKSPPQYQEPCGHDIFLIRLHPQICSIIAEMLPTRDVANLRLASKAFCHVFDLEHFWATRFIRHGGERAWLFEAQDSVSEMKDKYLSWKALYHSTRPSQLSGGLKDRIRIWNLVPFMLECTSVALDKAKYLPYFVMPWSASSTLKMDYSRTVRGLIDRNWRDEPEFFQGCRLCRWDEIMMEDRLLKVVVYFVNVGETRYVCGFELCFLDKDQKNVNKLVGYRSSTTKSLTIGGSGTLHGITVAVGSRGIHALQFLSEGASIQASPWAGDSQQLPVTNRLVKEGQKIHKLNLDLDVSFSAARAHSLFSLLRCDLYSSLIHVGL